MSTGVTGISDECEQRCEEGGTGVSTGVTAGVTCERWRWQVWCGCESRCAVAQSQVAMGRTCAGPPRRPPGQGQGRRAPSALVSTCPRAFGLCPAWLQTGHLVAHPHRLEARAAGGAGSRWCFLDRWEPPHVCFGRVSGGPAHPAWPRTAAAAMPVPRAQGCWEQEGGAPRGRTLTGASHTRK